VIRTQFAGIFPSNPATFLVPATPSAPPNGGEKSREKVRGKKPKPNSPPKRYGVRRNSERKKASQQPVPAPQWFGEGDLLKP